jgi:hypothetical protein
MVEKRKKRSGSIDRKVRNRREMKTETCVGAVACGIGPVILVEAVGAKTQNKIACKVAPVILVEKRKKRGGDFDRKCVGAGPK